MRLIFVDTLYWVALINPKDQWHQIAKNIKITLKLANFVTTEAVLIELLNFFSSYSPQMREVVAQVVYDILDAPDIRSIPITHEIFLSGLMFYEKRLDKGYSMVDCISMQVMRDYDLVEVLTHDKHFAQEGFQILL